MAPNPWGVLPIVRRRYALKFFTALFVIAIVVGAFGGVIYAHTGDELRTDVREGLVEDSRTEAEQLDVWFRSTERHMESLPRSTAFRSEDRVGISDSLHRTTERTAVVGTYYADPDSGRVHVTAGEDDVVADRRLSAAVRERVATAIEDPSIVTFSEAFETESGRPSMVVVSEVPSRDDRVVVGVIDLDALSAYMLGEHGEEDVVVLDREGTVVLADDRDRLLERDPVDPTALESTSGVRSIDGGTGGDREVGYASLENADWTLTTRLPVDAAYSLQTDVSRQILAMIVVVLGGMGLLGATIGRNTGRSVRRLAAEAERLEEGELAEPIESDRRDEIGDLYRSFDEMRRSLRERIEEARTARSEAERARAESERLSRRLERTADRYGETMRHCADGDLTRRLDPDAENEPMRRIAAEFNAMMDDLEATVAATGRFARTVEEASASTADGVAEVRSASEQVTTSIQGIADGADRQSERLAAVADEMNELSTTTEEIAATTDEVAALAERTAATGERARESARRAIEGLDDVETEANDAVAEVETLEAEMAEIDELLEFIRDVAEQTNMLALNASIEAARSGEAGEGFNAVADQVKELAAETKDAAEDIEDRLVRVTRQTDRVAAVVRETSAGVADHRGAVEESVDALEDISAYAVETSDGVQEIAAACEQGADATQEVVEMVDDVAAISEETSAEAETVAAAAEEQTSSLVEVSETADLLSERSRTLASLASSFEVDAAETLPEPREVGDDATAVGEEAGSSAADAFDGREPGEVVLDVREDASGQDDGAPAGEDVFRFEEE